MNIQIFGTTKCFDTKKAERYFSERKVRFQSINLSEKPMSRGKFASVMNAVVGLDKMINDKCKNKDLLALFLHLDDSEKQEKAFENQILLKTPIVRDGKRATVGYAPEVWKKWE